MTDRATLEIHDKEELPDTILLFTPNLHSADNILLIVLTVIRFDDMFNVRNSVKEIMCDTLLILFRETLR